MVDTLKKLTKDWVIINKPAHDASARAWMERYGKGRERLPMSVFNTLLKRGLIAQRKGAIAISTYEITERGRLVLEGHHKTVRLKGQWRNNRLNRLHKLKRSWYEEEKQEQ